MSVKRFQNELEIPLVESKENKGTHKRPKEWMTDQIPELIVKNIVDRRQTEYWDEIRRLRGGKQRMEYMPIRERAGTLLVKAAPECILCC